MGILVNLYYVDKATFLCNNAEIVDNVGKVMAFFTRPIYDKVVEKTNYYFLGSRYFKIILKIGKYIFEKNSVCVL